jgi:hypothetical protein
MAVDVIIDPSSGQIYWNDQAGSGTQTIAISGNATNAINVVGYSNFFSPGGGGLGTQILATFNDSATSTFTPGTNAYDLGSTSLRWNFYGTGGNFTGAISTSSTTASTSPTTGALVVSGGAGIAKTSYFGESVVIQGSTGSTTPTTGALVVTGGVGIGGSLNVGIAITSSATNLIAGFAGSVAGNYLGLAIQNRDNQIGAVTSFRMYNGANNSAQFDYFADSIIFPKRLQIQNNDGDISYQARGTNGFHSFAVNPGGIVETLRLSSAGATFYNTTASTSSTTGALVVTGGAGIAKTSYFGQSVFIQGTTASGSTTTGALVVTGGVGIGGSLQVFGTIDVADNIEVLSQKEVRFFNSANTFYTGLRAGSSSANVTFTLPIADGAANQVLYTNGSAGLAWTTVASVSAITTLNGLTAATQTFAVGTSGTDFNISSTTSTHTFNIPYAGAASTGLITTQAQTIAGAKTFSGNTAITASTASTNPTNGALVVTGGVGISGRLNVGRAITSTASGILAGFGGTVSGVASVFIQNTSSAFMSSAALALANDVDTAYISLYNSNSDTSSQELSINNGAGPIKLTSGSGQTISFLPGGGLGLKITSTGTSVERSTASTSATTGALTVIGGAGIAKTSYFGESVFIQGGTSSTSTTTGALTVAGGLGVVGDVYIASATNSRLNIMGSSGDEGGEIFLNKAVTNTTLTTGVSIDVNQNRLRIFETGGSNRGAYIDLTSCSTSVGTNLLVGSGASGLTSLNGLTSNSQTFATGTSGTDFNISSTTSTHTFNIPYAGSGATGLVTTQAQTIAGAKTFSGQTSVTNSTASTSTTTGALIITGGVGIAGSIWSGQHVVTDTTVSSTTSTGAMLVFGGLGVSGQVNAASLQTSGNALISGNLTFNGVGVFGNATSDTINSLARYISDILPSTDNLYDLGNNSLGWRNFRISGVGTIATLQVTSVTSGLWAGSAVTLAYGGTNNNISGVGHSYRVAIYNDAGTAITNISSAGTANSILFQSSQSASPIWAGQSQLVVGGASTAANIQGGALGNIHYQTGTNATGFVTNAAGSGASILSQTGNAAPLFLGQSQLSVGSATTATNAGFAGAATTATTSGSAGSATTATNAGFAGAATTSTTSGSAGSATTATNAGFAGAATSSALVNTDASTGTRFIVGTVLNTASGSTQLSTGSGITIGNNLLTTGALAVTNTTASSSTTTGALTIGGGVGVGGSLWTPTTFFSSISGVGHSNSAITSGVWSGTAISAVNGGTGQVSYAVGDILYASSTTALTRLGAGTAGSVLASGGTGAAPYWKVDATGGGGGTPAGSSSWLQYNNGGAFGATSHLAYNGNLNNDFVISAPYSGAIQGQINIGMGVTAFDGTTLGRFAGSASGTIIAANYASGFTGNFADFQLAGSSKFTIGFDGKITVVGVYSLPTTAGTAGSVLTSNGTGNQFYWSAPGAAGGGSGTVTSGTAGSVAFYTGTGTTVGGAPGFTYTTSGTASTINVFGGGAIGTTIFTVQATSSTSVRVGIGTNLPQYELEIVGELSATNKSFVIDHPTKPGKKLRYGSLEGPENGVYVRGELKGSNIIETPDHWIGLVYPDSFTVTLTPISRFSHLYVEKIEDYKVFIADDCMNPIHCYYTVWAERKDIPKLITEY